MRSQGYKIEDSREAPPPKDLSRIDGGVKDLLFDFNAFSEAFFCRRPSWWRQEAAKRTVEWLSSPDKEYVVMNMPPGVGKTTLFTNDIPLWLICGGGVGDPAIGRAIRIMLGSETKGVSVHFVDRIRRLLEMRRHYRDKNSGQVAELNLIAEFGRFRPLLQEGDIRAVWRADQFTVAQIGDIDLYEKEPTCQAASREAGFLGERVDFFSWDDLVTRKNSGNAEIAENLAAWFEDEAETRLEPGGVGLLVGQRLSPLDLYRNRLDATWEDEAGEAHPRYHHIIFPAHDDGRCDNEHRQRDEQAGCLLDESRLPWREVVKVRGKANYQTVYQQQDANYSDRLVQPQWLEGGTDQEGYEAVGCFDKDRGFFEWPAGPSINYVCVDPSAANFWAVEWWSVNPNTMMRHLIFGQRSRMQAGDFLDWNPKEGKHVGLMEELQARSVLLGHPIVTWIVEQNAAHRYLFQYEHFFAWRRKWNNVDVIGHQTQKNKADAEYGVEATLPVLYRTGMKRLPMNNKRGSIDFMNYMRSKRRELTEYPLATSDDTVMADWFGEYNMRRIIAIGKQLMEGTKITMPPRLPRYLERQYREVAI